MFYYAKAYFQAFFSLGSLAPFLYWPVVRNLPSILATLSAGEADFSPATQKKGLGDNEKSGFLQGDEFPRAPGRLTLWFEEQSLCEKVCTLICLASSHDSHRDFKGISLEPTTRSWKIPFKDRNKVV